MARRPVLGKLPGYPARARAPLQSPLQGWLPGCLDLFGWASQRFQPVFNDLKVAVLAKGIKRKPQAKTLREGDFFLDSLARVNFTTLWVALEVFMHEFGHQVAAVRGGVNKHIFTGCRHRAIQNRFQLFITWLASLKREVIAKNDKAFGAVSQLLNDIIQVSQVFLVYFNQAQALLGKAMQHGTHQRAFTSAARP